MQLESVELCIKLAPLKAKRVVVLRAAAPMHPFYAADPVPLFKLFHMMSWLAPVCVESLDEAHSQRRLELAFGCLIPPEFLQKQLASTNLLMNHYEQLAQVVARSNGCGSLV